MLANARIAPGEASSEVGAGDGLVAFGTLERIGEHGQLISSDGEASRIYFRWGIAVNHEDHVGLVRDGVSKGGVWGDFGSGTGAFTLALHDLAGPDVEIWSIDRDASALRTQRAAFARQFPESTLHTVTADFTKPMQLPPLDGILAANTIHFVRDRVSLLRSWKTCLKPTGQIILVEYDTDSGNRWVPYPVSFASLAKLARDAGYSEPELLNVHPSRYHDRMYAALLRRRDDKATNR